MVSGRIGEHSIVDVLTWVGLTSATGSLRVEASSSGDVFFDKGLLYYATLDDQPLRMTELDEAGITEEQWRQASQHPEAQLDFGAQLLAIGVPSGRIEYFITKRITAVVATLADLESGSFETGSGRHGFGPTLGVPVKDILDIASGDQPLVQKGYADGDLISFPRSVTSPVTLTAEQWSAVASLLAPTDFATVRRALGDDGASRLVAYLEANGLARISEAGTAQPPSPSSWWASDGYATDDFDPYQTSTEPTPLVVGDEAEPAFVETQTESEYSAPADEDPDGDENDFDHTEEGDLFDGLDAAPGRAAYAEVARLRSIGYAPPHVKPGAIRKLIAAVRGL